MKVDWRRGRATSRAGGRPAPRGRAPSRAGDRAQASEKDPIARRPPTDIFCPVGTAPHANAPRPEDDAGYSISFRKESPDRSDEINLEKNKYLDHFDQGTEVTSLEQPISVKQDSIPAEGEKNEDRVEGRDHGGATGIPTYAAFLDFLYRPSTPRLGDTTTSREEGGGDIDLSSPEDVNGDGQALSDAAATGKDTDRKVSHNHQMYSYGAKHSGGIVKITDLFDDVSELPNELPISFICGDSMNKSACKAPASSAGNIMIDEKIMATDGSSRPSKPSPPRRRSSLDLFEERLMTKASGGSAGSTWTKQKSSPYFENVGAVQVDEQAPQLNRRFFRGLDSESRASASGRSRRSRRARLSEGGQDDDDRDAQMERTAARMREEGQDDDDLDADLDAQLERVAARMRQGGRDDDNRDARMEGVAIGGGGQEAPPPGHYRRRRTSFGGTRGSFSDGLESIRIRRMSQDTRMSALTQEETLQENLVEATLVDEVEAEVVEAKRMSCFERRGRVCIPCLCILVAFFFTSAAMLGRKMGRMKDEIASAAMDRTIMPSFQPSMQPSSPPSHDPRPTLDSVQARGHVRCGLDFYENLIKEGVHFEMCRSIAAVLLGDPDKIEPAVGSFQKLKDREFDVLLMREPHTIETEMVEASTRAGFAFSAPYYYDGVSYVGNKNYVECAENHRRYAACSSLRICVYQGTSGQELVKSSFPSDFIRVGASNSMESMMNGTCNVAVYYRSVILSLNSRIGNSEGYVLGEKILSTEPYAAVTRRDDNEFSNIINLIVNTLFYGEEKGLTRNSSLCGKDANLTGLASDLNFLNAIFCVGNYGELYGDGDRDIMNQVNNGTTGMLYAIPFGDVATQYDEQLSGGALLGGIRKQGSLKCGVVVPFTENTTDRKGLVGMSVDYCHTLAAALFNGNYKAVKIFTFPGNDGSSFAALNNGTIDALAGGSSQWKHHFKISSSIGGFRFSSPYYYENRAAEDDEFFSMVTREEDALFSSFVECAVSSTIYAQEHHITKENSRDMPLISLFGGKFNWALRDAVSYSGSYDEMYEKNFVDAAKDNRGRNVLNRRTGPQIKSFPGLDVVLPHQSGNASDEGPF